MDIFLNILMVILIAGAIALGVLYFSWQTTIKNGKHLYCVGKVEYWQKSKIPMFGHVCVKYTKRGAPQYCMSQLMWKGKRPKDNSLCKWDIVTFKAKDQTITQARFIKKKNKKEA